MAYSGINEHAEGCRKQTTLDRSAYSRKMMMDGMIPKDVVTYKPQSCPEEEEPGYMRKMGSPPGISSSMTRTYHGLQDLPTIDLVGSHSATAIDRLRRDAVRAQQLVAYSAKIPYRFTSMNYNQQW